VAPEAKAKLEFVQGAYFQNRSIPWKNTLGVSVLASVGTGNLARGVKVYGSEVAVRPGETVNLPFDEECARDVTPTAPTKFNLPVYFQVTAGRMNTPVGNGAGTFMVLDGSISPAAITVDLADFVEPVAKRGDKFTSDVEITPEGTGTTVVFIPRSFPGKIEGSNDIAVEAMKQKQITLTLRLSDNAPIGDGQAFTLLWKAYDGMVSSTLTLRVDVKPREFYQEWHDIKCNSAVTINYAQLYATEDGGWQFQYAIHDDSKLRGDYYIVLCELGPFAQIRIDDSLGAGDTDNRRYTGTSVDLRNHWNDFANRGATVQGDATDKLIRDVKDWVKNHRPEIVANPLLTNAAPWLPNFPGAGGAAPGPGVETPPPVVP
jgi:hypothetical protein